MPTFSADRSFAESLDAADELAVLRERFVHDDPDLIYLDGHSLGRLGARTQARIADVVDQEWGVGLVRSWDQWVTLPVQVGDMLGEHLLGAAPGQVLICDSVTVNLYKLAWAALSASPDRDVIVTDDDNFPTDRYVLQGLADQFGKELRMLHTDMDEGVSTHALADLLDERVALVSLSHVAYRSGALAEMAALTELVHSHGALVLWDLCHSVGAVPVELDSADADLAVGCTYKYVNAGPGAPALLYVRGDLQPRLHQPIWGWFGQKDQFAMGPTYDPVPGIERFATGTPQVVGTVAVEEGVRLLAEAGVDRLRAKSAELTKYLVTLADEWLAPLGFSLASPRNPARRGGHVTLRHVDAGKICDALLAAKVVGDHRVPDRIRLCPAPMYTSFANVWDGLDRLRQLVADESYLRAPEPSGASAD